MRLSFKIILHLKMRALLKSFKLPHQMRKFLSVTYSSSNRPLHLGCNNAKVPKVMNNKAKTIKPHSERVGTSDGEEGKIKELLESQTRVVAVVISQGSDPKLYREALEEVLGQGAGKYPHALVTDFFIEPLGPS